MTYLLANPPPRPKMSFFRRLTILTLGVMLLYTTFDYTLSIKLLSLIFLFVGIFLAAWALNGQEW